MRSEKAGIMNPYLTVRIPSGESRKEKSRSSARSAAEQALRPFYDRELPREAAKAANEAAKRIQGYCNDGLDSAYHQKCDGITRIIEETVVKLQKEGLNVLKPEEITVKPEIPYDLKSSIDIAQGSRPPKTLSSYIDETEPLEDVSYVENKRLFKFDDYIRVVHYSYVLYSIGYNIKNDVQKVLDENSRRANELLDSTWVSFLKNLDREINDRKATLKSQVDACRNTLKQESDTAEIEAAISHLDTLTKGVSQ